MILRSIFSHWGQLRDSNTTIKKGSNIHWCSRRTHDALRAGGWKLLNRMKISNFFLLLKYIFFSIYTALRKQQKILACFPEDKLSTIYLDLQIQKVFTPRLLMHRVFFWSISECLNLFNSLCLSPSIVLSVKRWISNHTVTAGKGFKYAKMLEKLQNLQNVEDLSEEQCSVQLFRTNKGLMNNQHKTKEQSWIIQVTSHSIKKPRVPKLWRGLFE